MKSLNTIDSNSTHDLFDYSVTDQAGENLGTLHSMWNNAETGKLEFLGVKTGWLLGSNHVVPADKAQIDGTARTIQVPYPLGLIKDAPTVDADATISDEQEAEIYRYYGGARGTTTSIATRTTETAAAGLTAATTATATVAPAKAQTGTAKAGDDIEVALREEQVKVGKRTVDAGSVRLRKVIRTEVVNQPVEVRRE